MNAAAQQSCSCPPAHAGASSLAVLSVECLLTQTQQLSNTQKPSLVSRNKSQPALVLFPCFASVLSARYKRAPSSDISQPTQQSPPTQSTLSILHRKKSAGKVICRNNVLIFLLAFQNIANFLSLVQLMESLGRSPTSTWSSSQLAPECKPCWESCFYHIRGANWLVFLLKSLWTAKSRFAKTKLLNCFAKTIIDLVKIKITQKMLFFLTPLSKLYKFMVTNVYCPLSHNGDICSK